MCANLPLVFRLMPESFRVDKVHRVLGPAPCWFTKDQVVGKVKFQLESTVSGAEVDGHKVNLFIKNGAGQSSKLQFDHLIAATGYRTDVRRLLLPRCGDTFRVDPRRSLAGTFGEFRIICSEPFLRWRLGRQHFWSITALCVRCRLCGSASLGAPPADGEAHPRAKAGSSQRVYRVQCNRTDSTVKETALGID